MQTELDVETIRAERKAFEDAAFNQRFMSGIKRVSQTAQFPFSVDCPTQDEWVAMDENGHYKEESLNPAWWAWLLRAECALTPSPSTVSTCSAHRTQVIGCAQCWGEIPAAPAPAADGDAWMLYGWEDGVDFVLVRNREGLRAGMFELIFGNAYPSETDLNEAERDELQYFMDQFGDEDMWSNNGAMWHMDVGEIGHVAAIKFPAQLLGPVEQTFQERVRPWMLACFGKAIASDPVERNHRYLEESLELVQACGCTISEAHQLVDYVFGRPAGEIMQEAGGAMVTLAALCQAKQISMHGAGEIELRRIWGKIDKIRAKQAAKPKHSPLPEAVMTSSTPEAGELELERLSKRVADEQGYGNVKSAARAAILSYSQAETKRADQSDAVSAIDRAAFFKVNAELADTEKALEICNEALSDAQNQFIAYKAKYEAATAALDAAKREVGELQGTVNCPMCGHGKPHSHSANEVIAWLRLQATRFLNPGEKDAISIDGRFESDGWKLMPRTLTLEMIEAVIEIPLLPSYSVIERIQHHYDALLQAAPVAALAAKSTEPKERA